MKSYRMGIRQKKSLFFVLILFFESVVFAGQPCFNVKDYGAAGDGCRLDSGAINKAILSCAEKGGGTVYVPAGTYQSGSIRLKSNITLFIDRGAVIIGTESKDAYDAPEELGFKEYQDFGHSHWKNSLIWGIDIENVSIVGGGTINGGKMTAGQARSGSGIGNKSISLKNCRNITLRDVTLSHGGHFAILLTGCNNVSIDNLIVDTQRDGMNIDCCKNVRISNCIVNSDDDGICLKSSFALGQLRATEDVVITNCVVSAFKEGSVISGQYIDEGPHMNADGSARKRISGIKFGTESNGGFKNITISNCVFNSCWGIGLMSVDGGVIENITISNISMKDIFDAPIFIRLGNRGRGPEGTPVAQVRNITISNLTATVRHNNFGSIISGLANHKIENITLDNITINCPGGGTEDMAKNIVSEQETGASPTMFGDMPSYGLFARHVDGLTICNVQMVAKEKDYRPAMVLENVKGLELSGFKGTNPVDIAAATMKIN